MVPLIKIPFEFEFKPTTVGHLYRYFERPESEGGAGLPAHDTLHPMNPHTLWEKVQKSLFTEYHLGHRLADRLALRVKKDQDNKGEAGGGEKHKVWKFPPATGVDIFGESFNGEEMKVEDLMK